MTGYREVGSHWDQAYPDWLRALRKTPGCYVIRSKESKQPLYVGASERDLYKTITRHFSEWQRAKKWWRGQYARQQHDPGTTYERRDVEVAVHVTKTGPAAIELERKLIARLKPRDNINDGVEPLEDAPF